MIVSQDSLVEDAVEITNNTFIRSTIDPEAAANLGSSSWFSSVTQAASSYKTPLIITGAIVAAMLAVAVPAKMMLGKSGESGAVNINNFNTANSSSNNANKVDVDAGSMDVDSAETGNPPLHPAQHNPAIAEQGEEEIHQAEVEDEEVRIWKILDKAAHLRSPQERIAIDKWSMQQDPFQM